MTVYLSMKSNIAEPDEALIEHQSTCFSLKGSAHGDENEKPFPS